MKRTIVAIASVVLWSVSFGQVKKPVKWTFSAKKISSTTYEVHITAAIDPGWHTYSQTTPGGGPVPTAISFNKNPLVTLDGGAREKGKLEQRHEPIFGVDVKQYSNKVVFVQTIKLKSAAKTAVNGSVEYMVCDDKQCLPPATEKFSVSLQ